MDATLSQILSALYQSHAQIDALQQRIAALEAKVAEIPPKEEPKADGIHEVVR